MYYHVGRVERWSTSAKSYTWRNGYSRRADGGAQPWITKGEARAEAAREDRRATFKDAK